MKNMLLFGAGKSATELIFYLNDLVKNNVCTVTIVDANIELLKNKLPENTFIHFEQIDILDESERKRLIQSSTVVISLMPPNLHYIIALDCITYKKHLLTASYIDEQIQLQKEQIKNAGVLFLYEMGLDPGIDHMSAMKIIHEIHSKGGKIDSFISHCGGLISPECNTNPWSYKISWNPKNIILAGKSGAIYKRNGVIEETDYTTLFENCDTVDVNDEIGQLSYYFNRDSLKYIQLYGLENANTFIRTTLRYSNFCQGWKWIVQLQLTDEQELYDTKYLTPNAFLKKHLEIFKLQHVYQSINELSVIQQFDYLFNNNSDFINKGKITAAEILQSILEEKLKLVPNDKDMIVMLHEFEYTGSDKKYYTKSSLIVKGNNEYRTAMAKTVGLPLGIAARMLIEEKIAIVGLQIPTIEEIYEPVLEKLTEFGIQFEEKTTLL
ncbi:MAG: saccharopine dehydrogenase C-terminal domain-containing protein [Chitinophagaceae bacterium]